MLTLYATYYLVLCAGNVWFSSASSDYYNCENGVYETLYRVTAECRDATYTPNLRDLRKKQNHVSGRDVTDLLQKYCSVANAAADCVEGYINFLPCLREELETFRTMKRRSDWFCENSTVKEIFRNIYNDLPLITLNYRTNECYKDAPPTAYSCIRRYLNVAASHADRREIMKRIFSSFRCTFRKLSRKCGRDTSLLLVTLEYDWLIIPPALGINVSDAIITTAKIKLT